jgi:hypothetical protein
MILFILFSAFGISSLYIGSASLKLYQSGITNTTKRLFLKIINNAMSKEINDEDRKKLMSMKRFYLIHLLLFYGAMIYAFIEIYIAATTKS